MSPEQAVSGEQAGGDDPAVLLSGAGIDDGIQRLWTPHRMAYLQGEGKPATAAECPFCLIPQHPDEGSLVVARGELVYAVLNLYPYAAGHLLICPYRHIPSYTDVTSAELAEFGAFTQIAMRTLRASSGCHGFNIGMNQGSVAGAGIADHLHQHVVPRWGGDSNFMPIVGRTKVLPELLGDTRARLAAAWKIAASPV
ncbi:MAG TPA: HIT domain-containing protein [Mycobacteriales bacterium]|nr:HIT domain-containing protein [Mycobacteriales bacterium]